MKKRRYRYRYRLVNKMYRLGAGTARARLVSRPSESSGLGVGRAKQCSPGVEVLAGFHKDEIKSRERSPRDK